MHLYFEIPNGSLKLPKKIDLLKFLGNFELKLLLGCNQIDIEAVVSIKYGWSIMLG